MQQSSIFNPRPTSPALGSHIDWHMLSMSLQEM